MAATKHLRQPANLEMPGGKSKRQRVWEAIRASRDGFTLQDIANVTRIDTDTIRTYLYALARGRFVEQSNISHYPCEKKQYRLVKDNGLEAPRLTRDGELVTQGRAQEQMWRTMYILGGDFNYRELAGLASTPEVTVSPITARDYLKHLAHAGYVVVVVKGQGRGAGGVPSRYRFNRSRYSGPRPPMVQRTNAIYDPNIGQVVWQQEIDHDDF